MKVVIQNHSEDYAQMKCPIGEHNVLRQSIVNSNERLGFECPHRAIEPIEIENVQKRGRHGE